LVYGDLIVIRPSDKTSGIVVLNRNDYENEIYNELKDNDTYTEIDKDITTKIENKIKKSVETMYKQKLITKDLKDYVMPKGTQPGKVQANPKIHKKNIHLEQLLMASITQQRKGQQ
jgi:hypothetical protein